MPGLGGTLVNFSTWFDGSVGSARVRRIRAQVYPVINDITGALENACSRI